MEGLAYDYLQYPFPDTSDVRDHTIGLIIQNQNGIAFEDSSLAVVGIDGTWTATIDAPPAGDYTILIKGVSHLQKKYTGVALSGGVETVDLTQGQENWLVAGDVNSDNKITVEDIWDVSSYFNDFRTAVTSDDSSMFFSDINKDGYITIQDLALAAHNWIDFTVEGEE